MKSDDSSKSAAESDDSDDDEPIVHKLKVGGRLIHSLEFRHI